MLAGDLQAKGKTEDQMQLLVQRLGELERQFSAGRYVAHKRVGGGCASSEASEGFCSTANCAGLSTT